MDGHIPMCMWTALTGVIDDKQQKRGHAAVREIGVSGESWREVAVDEYDQNSLYKCMKFSKNKD